MCARQRPGPVVVVVDDDRDTVEVLALGLTRWGADVTTYVSAEEAVVALQTLAPDVLMTDLTLSSRDGLWLIEQVRAIPHLAGLPIVVLTGHRDIACLDAARRAGADDVLVKPVESRVLYDHIRHLIRG